MNAEKTRLQDASWKTWGPYVSDRQWGTVREDYSANGDAWSYITHDMARSKAFRWGEEGIAGICDDQQYLCFAIALWNKKDPIIKERYFGLSNPEGNHGEDVKELYYYLDSTPSHSYMKMLYKYPQHAFPYEQLVNENKQRGRDKPEFELIDTGIFDNNEYFDVQVEYAKNSSHDLLIEISVYNRSEHDAPINVMPTVWFRNTWAWGRHVNIPTITKDGRGVVEIYHRLLGEYWLVVEEEPEWLFCNNETNIQRLYNAPNLDKHPKDAINDYIVNGVNTVSPDKKGTKAAANYDLVIPAGGCKQIKLRLTKNPGNSFEDFDKIFAQRIAEADEFYNDLYDDCKENDSRSIIRQAFAGMLWNKQFYNYNVYQWLTGDPMQPPPPDSRLKMRNSNWQHIAAREIISMPDKWEYPWFAAWDLAFHCLPLAKVDPDFAKKQLIILTQEWYMHPNGQLPAYEWEFNDTNPPVHAMAAWKVYQIDKAANNGKGDTYFLESVFHKLILNFTWWVNRKDSSGNNIFQGGFLGLDNIGVFDRNAPLPTGGYIEQADGTSWMAMYALNLMRIATELTATNPTYAEIASKFFDHFMYIAGAMTNLGDDNKDMWDDEDGFFYDRIVLPNGSSEIMRVRSIVGLIPMFAVEVMEAQEVLKSPIFSNRLKWFYDNRPDLSAQVSHLNQANDKGSRLVSLLRGHRMKALLKRILDESEFLSPYGVRSVSKYHLEHPYTIEAEGRVFSVKYLPAESDSGLFGGNSNWRGPIWLPINYLLIESLVRYYTYYGDGFKVECPTGSGQFMNLNEVANELRRRLSSIFKADENGKRAVYGSNQKFYTDKYFADHILFHEYFDGDTGKGLGANHQTGWTGLIVSSLSVDLHGNS
ncbi:MGH1-like glycoside hydrolase domain-containing protein [Mucilaginibacter sp. KACC 22063]|uniref:MGH1-like glycoside hydrolase domain-containing protein n=1 Tax=Mucilaginibacter sp. KACC 22063 TaxID=3025666 RepID=UPI002366149D|nr:glucosidase [Mucilaginibacter sp. KACC 22063]WDF53670.1 glucosidase [Mucilaginibacter sp. KACC 22063]